MGRLVGELPHLIVSKGKVFTLRLARQHDGICGIDRYVLGADREREHLMHHLVSLDHARRGQASVGVTLTFVLPRCRICRQPRHPRL
jgi:hypothetical protein